MDFQLDGHGRIVPGGPVKDSVLRLPIIICTGCSTTINSAAGPSEKENKSQVENKTRISVAESGHVMIQLTAIKQRLDLLDGIESIYFPCLWSFYFCLPLLATKSIDRLWTECKWDLRICSTSCIMISLRSSWRFSHCTSWLVCDHHGHCIIRRSARSLS
jgi:hypothetical protein